MTTRKQAFGLGGFLLATFVAGWIGSIASRSAPDFYRLLESPEWAPPSAVFGPVWTTLYLLMAVAAWLVWRTGRNTRSALGLYFVQLAANSLWSWLFFAWHRGALAFAEVVILLVLIAATAIAFSRHSRLAAVLLVPYLLWVSFASALTWSLWQRNPGLLGP